MREAGARARRRGTPRGGAAALLCLAAAVACGNEPNGGAPAPDTARAEAPGEPAPTAAAAAPAPAPPDSTEWTIGTLSAPSTVTGGAPPLPVLTALRTGVHPEYERVTIELQSGGGLPGYRIEYVDRPLHDCGSGEPTYPVGDAWLEIRLEPAAAHTEEGRATLGTRDLPVDQRLLRRIYRTCDFEGIVTLVLALSEPNPFRVLTLDGPPRIAVDVRR